MTSNNPFPPTLRENRRYIVFQVHAAASGGRPKFSRSEVNNAAWRAVLDLIGKKGAGDADFALIEFNEQTQKGILRTNAPFTDKVIAALVLLTDVNLNPAFVHCLKTTGTIKQAEKLIS